MVNCFCGLIRCILWIELFQGVVYFLLHSRVGSKIIKGFPCLKHWYHFFSFYCFVLYIQWHWPFPGIDITPFKPQSCKEYFLLMKEETMSWNSLWNNVLKSYRLFSKESEFMASYFFQWKKKTNHAWIMA